MTREELNRLEAIEAQTRSDAKDAKIEADSARIAFGEVQLKTAGIVINETVCLYKKYFYDKEESRGFVIGIETSGHARVCEVTKANKIHMGRNGKLLPIEILKIEGETQ